MEYKRKKRWANYGSYKCREYLRNDFSHECAYCKLQEKEVGLIDAKFFEIDHFRPQSDNDGSFNPHLYENLYYSCEKCNGEKSDTWSEELLDPCKDDIFSGENPPIIGGYNPETFYKYIGQNEKGQYYIDVFKLNSRYHTRIRKRRVCKKNNIKSIDELIDQILIKFSSIKKTDELHNYIRQLDMLRSKKQSELAKLSKDEYFECVEKYLISREITYDFVMEEYNMDVKCHIDDKTYYCELIIDDKTKIDNEKKIKRIRKEKLIAWFDNLKYKFGILYYCTKLDKLYFYPVSEQVSQEALSEVKSILQIELSDIYLL